MLHVEDYLYADETEITNAGYLLYLDWMIRVYGENSFEFQKSVPDTTKIECFGLSGQQYLDYFLGVETKDHPVVGISLAQAISYTNWRTNRVIEFMLIKAGNIKINPAQTKDNCFTVERYINGELDQIINHVNIRGPIFRIPTKYDWLKLNKVNNIRYELKLNSSDTLSAYQNLRKVRNRKKQIVHNLYGNVSEMVGNNISMGGSWKHSLKESHRDSLQIFSSPNCWTGFRNVASLFEIKVKIIDDI
jgi:hypothetical protein